MNIQKENSFQLAEESRFYAERIEVETVNQSFHPSAFVWRGQREELFISKARESVSSKDESCREEEK